MQLKFTQLYVKYIQFEKKTKELRTKHEVSESKEAAADVDGITDIQVAFGITKGYFKSY